MTGVVNVAKYAIVILVFILIMYSSYFMGGYFTVPYTNSTYVFPEVKANADPWYNRVVTQGEMDATAWINANTKQTDKFVADIFGAELIMGMTTRVSTVGGDWANALDPVLSMSDTDKIYTTDSASEAHNLAVAENCQYVFLPDRQTFSGYTWVYGNHTKFDNTQYFKLVYENPGVKIYKVL